MRRFAGLAVALLAASLFAPVTAVASTDDPGSGPVVTTRPGSKECWGRGRTLVHFIVFNEGPGRARYTFTAEVEGRRKPVVHHGGLPVAQGVNEGVVLRRGEVASVTVASTGDSPAWHVDGVRGKKRCGRR